MGHGKSWKILSTNDRFHIILKTTSILGHGKHQKSPGKGHRKSWNFIRSKETKSVLTLFLRSYEHIILVWAKRVWVEASFATGA